MKKVLIAYILLTASFLLTPVMGQKRQKTDANIVGHVVCNGRHLPYVTVVVKGTAIGTMTDASGHYMLVNLPEGRHTIIARSLGYKPAEKDVNLVAGKTLQLNFDLEEDVLGLEEVVVTGNRSGEERSRSPVIINTVSPKLFSAIQSVQIREGLDFCPGLRTETDCQNCGFSQLRINGMEGAYSQVLINGHAVFSSLAGVYGLELLPSNMIERIEVIRGGGSALYGSNAIAGTVNILLKDPLSNTFSMTIAGGGVGAGVSGRGPVAGDLSFQANASVVSNDRKAGMTLFGNYQKRDHFDANDDGFSEIPELNNLTFGIRGFHRIGYHNKLTLDLFHIAEQRRGGGPFDVPPHEAAIAEALHHSITSGSVTWDLFLNEHDKISAFFSGQHIDRDSYYGARYSLKDYGHTGDFTFVAGGQYEKVWDDWKITAGAELRGETLRDRKLGYSDYDHAVIAGDTIVSVPHMPDVLVADQQSYTGGTFFQGEYRAGRWALSGGLRYDHYTIRDDLQAGNDNDGDVISPRVNVKFDVSRRLQLRGSISTGYRAPQVYDEDLHIASSGSRKVIIRNDPDLQQEKSRSFSLSLYLHGGEASVPYKILAEGFYTCLLNPFVHDIGIPDEEGVVYYIRRNAAAGARVKGINMEINLVPAEQLRIRSGFTLQQSRYEEPQNFGETRFFRTPSAYGYMLTDMELTDRMSLALSYKYTGPMLVPYFGPEQPDPGNGTLKRSRSFHNIGVKFSRTVKLNGTKVRFIISVKNIFNSWQKDFDRGIARDPSYIYGPAYPRSVYAGMKFGNLL